MMRVPLVEPRWLTEIKRNGEYPGEDRKDIVRLIAGAAVSHPLPPMPAKDLFTHELRLRGKTVRYDAKDRMLHIL